MLSAKELIFLVRLLRANGLKAVKRHLAEADASHSLVLCENPPAILVTNDRDRWGLHRRFKGLPLTIVVLFSWSLDEGTRAKEAGRVAQELERFPEHRTLLLCNEEKDLLAFRDANVPAVFASHNCLVDESTFRPVPGVRREFSAVHNGAMAPYKRHELAAEIPSLLLITYRWGGTHAHEYETRIRQLLRHAFWANDELAGGGKILPSELPKIYSQCSVGLCLSANEGAMFASMEYLLCGLPIVSTPSTGGRDVFFDPRHTLIVAPDPKAIAEAVEELESRHLDPNEVRESALEKIRRHRTFLADRLKKCGIQSLNIPQPPGSHGPLTFRKYKEIKRSLLERSAQTRI